MGSLFLRPGRERPVRQFHPWVFSGAIDRVIGDPADGDEVEVLGANGEWLARATWSSHSQIRARIFTWERSEHFDHELFVGRIRRAVAARARLGIGSVHAARLIHGEADGFPGLIVDRYGAFLSIQLLTAAAAQQREAIVQALAAELAPAGIYERSDVEVRAKEGLAQHEGPLWGDEPPDLVICQPAFASDPPPLYADLRHGQKTGAYLDQALNRARLAPFYANAEILDAFCYNGGFSLYAAKAGGQVVAADSSAHALGLLETHAERLGLSAQISTVEADIFKLLRHYREIGRQFDLIILDPPKFASQQRHVDRAARAYKDLSLVALQILRPGGMLASFSCSGAISPDLFQKIVFGAAVDARRDLQIVERLSQSPDHPILLSFPESEYLKGLLCHAW